MSGIFFPISFHYYVLFYMIHLQNSKTCSRYYLEQRESSIIFIVNFLIKLQHCPFEIKKVRSNLIEFLATCAA